MLTKDVEAYFGSKPAIVKALGNRHKSAIYQWDETVPLKAALELQELTHGALRVDMSLYSKAGRTDVKKDPAVA
jgi:hypothetical protein